MPEVKQHELPLAMDIADSDTLTGTKGPNVGDDKKFSWSLLVNKLRNIFAPVANSLLSGGVILVEDNNVYISDAVYRIDGFNFSAPSSSYFVDNSLTGLQRFVAWYGNTLGQVIMVDGVEGATASLPAQPANTALIGYVLVNDGGLGVPEYDMSQFVTNSYLSSLLDTVFGVFKLRINTQPLTTNRTATFQNKSGIVAYLDDIHGGVVAAHPENPDLPTYFIAPPEDVMQLFFGTNTKRCEAVDFRFAVNGFRSVSRMSMLGEIMWLGNSFSISRNDDRMVYKSGGIASPNTSTHAFYTGDGTNYDSPFLAAVIHKNYFEAKSFRLQDLNEAPASSISSGKKGEIRFTTDFIYVCVADNTWVRTALTTW